MIEALEAAVAAARAGGAELAARREDHGTTRSKSSPTDFVTEADIASGVAVARALLERDRNARFVIEEDEVYDLAGATRGSLDDPEVWVIDPLDGTTSYIHGFPCYSVSVALLQDGQPTAGAVFNVASGEMNAAAAGMGATRDTAPLHVSRAETVPEALLITGFPYDRGAALDRQLAVLAAFLRAPVHGIRRDGSAAVDCCHVAGRRADGFWEYGLKPWDMAAGVVILREAGAAVTDVDGRPWTAASTSICAANSALQKDMLAVIRSATAS
jgi:myo-inositol-1(or 4)-monophosphatase